MKAIFMLNYNLANWYADQRVEVDFWRSFVCTHKYSNNICKNIHSHLHTSNWGKFNNCICVCACDLVCTLSFHFSAHITERFKCEICLIAKLCVRACNVQVIVEPSYALFKRFRKNSYHTTLMHELSCSIANFLYEMFCKYLSMWHENELIQ